jgi:hypothetical protein
MTGALKKLDRGLQKTARVDPVRDLRRSGRMKLVFLGAAPDNPGTKPSEHDDARA